MWKGVVWGGVGVSRERYGNGEMWEVGRQKV